MNGELGAAGRITAALGAAAIAGLVGIIVGWAGFALVLGFVITPLGLGSIVWGLVWSASMVLTGLASAGSLSGGYGIGCCRNNTRSFVCHLCTRWHRVGLRAFNTDWDAADVKRP